MVVQGGQWTSMVYGPQQATQGRWAARSNLRLGLRSAPQALHMGSVLDPPPVPSWFIPCSYHSAHASHSCHSIAMWTSFTSPCAHRMPPLRPQALLQSDPVVAYVKDTMTEEVGSGMFRFKAEVAWNGDAVVQRYLDRWAGRARVREGRFSAVPGQVQNQKNRTRTSRSL